MSPLSIIICILGLGILAAVHEIGHFIVARLLKIKVYELSVFVGPKLFSWKRKDIEYYIRLIPLGAYVRFSEIDDETGELKDESRESDQSGQMEAPFSLSCRSGYECYSRHHHFYDLLFKIRFSRAETGCCRAGNAGCRHTDDRRGRYHPKV